MSDAEEKELGVTYHLNPESLARACDVITINAPLHPGTENLFNAKMLANMKKGSFIVNTARGKIMDRDALVDAVKSGHIEGYAGDVWFPQPAAKDHPVHTPSLLSLILLLTQSFGAVIASYTYNSGDQCLVMQ
jgi:formate dehydrogenase